MKLITHSDKFHYDEVLATAILLKIYPDASLIRTRDEKLIETGDIVYDVGRVFDPSKNRFDHHQSTFKEVYSPKYDVKLSSAGLIFKYFHKQLFKLYGLDESSEIFEFLVEKIYSEYFLFADAIDNGVNIFGSIKPRTVADVVAGFNRYDSNQDQKEEDKRFMKALANVQLDLDNYLNYIFNDYAVTFSYFYNELKDFNKDIYYTEKSVSSDLLWDLNEMLKKDLKFVIVKSKDGFRILTFRTTKNDFGIRYPLHSEWRGLANQTLENVSEIPGCIFVHASGFTGGNKTFEGAMEMCKKSLEHLKQVKASK